MAYGCGSERFVVLRGGLAVPIAPVLLLLDLETRGCTLMRDGDALVVGPASLVRDEDRAQLARWKSHLLALVDYQAPGVQ